MSNPINFEECQRAYHNDVTYRRFVDTVYYCIDQLAMTPSEVRQACIFACYLHEIRKRPLIRKLTTDEMRQILGD